MSHDVAGPSCQGTLKNHVILGIRKERAPAKVDETLVKEGAQGVKIRLQIIGRVTGDHTRPSQNLLIFKHQGCGCESIKAAVSKGTHYPVGRTIP